jgi:hypothetical protein
VAADEDIPLGAVDLNEDPLPLGAADPGEVNFEIDDPIPLGVLGVPQTGGDGAIDGAVTELAGMGMILSAEMAAILAVMKKKKDEKEEENN